MIKILYLFTNKNSASFIFYKNSLKKEKKLNIKFSTQLPKNYKKYDFIFLQSNFTKVKNFDKFKNDVKTVLVEPRLGHNNNLKLKFSLVIFNSIESQIFFSNKILFSKNIIYPTFPEYEIKSKKKFKNDGKVVITYHGNKVHLENSKEQIISTLNNISSVFKNKKINVFLIYNIKNLGFSKNINSKNNITIKHVQYSSSNIVKILSNTDIGLVPQTLKRKSFFQVLSKKKNNYDLIFKESTNLGRHLVFGQFKIPVITEPTPSVIKFFDDESMEYIVHDENSWFKVLKKLIIDRDLRSSLGIKLYKIWQRNFRHEVLNKKLVKILDEIKKS